MNAPAPLIKVCGITRLEDALALEALGARYLGFNFWPGSKRYIAPEAAAAIVAKLQGAEAVGVFVDHSAAEINAIAAKTGIRWAQLHGSEGWDVLDDVELPVIKAIPQDRIGDWGGLRAEWDAHAGSQPRYFLVDSKTEQGFGGTGAAFDWKLLASDPLPRPYFLAGGIGPGNLADAVRATNPYALDLNSKVESAPGVKDAGLVKRCLELLQFG
jgi:phosphoribosylanthranilate isomerase